MRLRITIVVLVSLGLLRYGIECLHRGSRGAENIVRWNEPQERAALAREDADSEARRALVGYVEATLHSQASAPECAFFEEATDQSDVIRDAARRRKLR